MQKNTSLLVTEALLFLRKLHNCDTQISVVEKTPDASALPPMTSKCILTYTYLLTHENELKKMKKKKNLPCNRFSVSQNFCNSWKYLSKMYTFDIPLPNCWFCEFVAVVDITLFLCVIFTSFFQRRRSSF